MNWDQAIIPKMYMHNELDRLPFCFNLDTLYFDYVFLQELSHYNTMTKNCVTI